MELTKEYFDEIIKGLATKDDLKSLANKQDIKELERYVDDVAATILEAVDFGFNRVNRRLDGRDKRLEKIEGELSAMKNALHLS